MLLFSSLCVAVLCLSSVTCFLKYWNRSGYCWCMVLLAFANRKGCGGSLWPEHIPRKVEQCYMKPEPTFNFQEAWGPVVLQNIQIWALSQRSSFTVSCLHFWVHSMSVFTSACLPPDTTKYFAFQITLVPSLTSICWFHFWGKKMQETFVSSKFLQKWNIQITLWLVVALPLDTCMPWPTTLWKW